MSCKKNHKDENYIFQRTLGNGIISNGEGGYHVIIDPENTHDLDTNPKYVYDVEIRVNDINFVKTIIEGVIRLKPDTTR